MIFYEVAPKSYYYEFKLVTNSDGSKFIDYTPVNKTRREFPPPLTPNATPLQIACAVNYRDVYFVNNTARVFYRNESVAIFRNGTFTFFERPPAWFFGGCMPGSFLDGRLMMNCTTVNQTITVFFTPLNYKNTIYENATAPARDEIYVN
jgi:hypothetical protein